MLRPTPGIYTHPAFPAGTSVRVGRLGDITKLYDDGRSEPLECRQEWAAEFIAAGDWRSASLGESINWLRRSAS